MNRHAQHDTFFVNTIPKKPAFAGFFVYFTFSAGGTFLRLLGVGLFVPLKQVGTSNPLPSYFSEFL